MVQGIAGGVRLNSSQILLAPRRGAVQPEPRSWDYPDESSNNHLIALHPYPARFIPAIPRRAIGEFLGRPGVVWDPFAGCGTSIIEANQMGHTSVGIDVNHLAVMLQRVYTTPLQDADLRTLQKLTSQLAKGISYPSLNEVLSRRQDIPRLTHWFSGEAIRTIEAFLNQVEESRGTENGRQVARFVLSRVLVRLSRQQSDTQYRATRPDVRREDALQTILQSLRQVLAELPRMQARLTNHPVFIRLGDARETGTFTGLPAPDLVVTSPPYPNSYEYWLYHKYRMFWLDMDPLWSRAREIGARPFYSGSGPLGPEDFRDDMHRVLRNIDTASKPETTQVWIAGNGVVKGEIVPTARIIGEEANRLGWRVLWQHQRLLQRRHSSFQGIGRLASEDILVLKKQS